MRQFFCYNHQGKADAYIQALTTRGWRQIKDPGQALFILSDSDVLTRFKSLKEYHRRNIKIFLYPHAARPNIFWDFPDTRYAEFITAHFVAAEGHIEIMRAYGNPYPLEVVGWHLCPIHPFRPRTEIKRIVFAPIHPNNNGFLCKLDKELNQETFKRLQSLMTDTISLTVRHLHDLKQNGLWRAGGVEYIEGKPDLSCLEIDQADLVVGHQTYPTLAVARGVPTLMMGEWHRPRWGGTEEKLSYVRSWEKYRDLLMYPLDILAPAEADLPALLNRAIQSDCDTADWRRRLIGEPFAPGRFVDALESFL